MIAWLRSRWQKIKQHPVATELVLLFATLVVLVIGGYKFSWDWTGFNGNSKSGKTLWDWLQLFIIPLALAIIAILFNRSERDNEQRIASDNQKETALQEYVKEMSELLLHENLRKSQPMDEVRTIARVRTLTVLPRLDGKRKRSVLQFLHESSLIDRGNSIVDLEGADLTKANLMNANLAKADLSKVNLYGAYMNRAIMYSTDLTDANLRRARLSGANLGGANLELAVLIGASLVGADLTEADLNGANLTEANLLGATLIGADLSAATLIGADLTSAELRRARLHLTNLAKAILVNADLSDAELFPFNVTAEQLKQTRSLKGATMPDQL